ncbi:hypothetical protein PRUPE_1G265700 [Prunus persica]|uniref:Uncharacterized protein n=1 Tax=Prunus persica TaxID=3760 RepID=A0A251R3U2_PRUPE|nr:hypothetical protein PRUPE_1G265700 [Prunus persica]
MAKGVDLIWIDEMKMNPMHVVTLIRFLITFDADARSSSFIFPHHHHDGKNQEMFVCCCCPFSPARRRVSHQTGSNSRKRHSHHAPWR